MRCARSTRRSGRRCRSASRSGSCAACAAFWDTHRHRAAPQIAAGARPAAGRWSAHVQHRGSFMSLRRTAQGDAVTWQPAGGGAPVTTEVAIAVDCTGPQSDVRRLGDPLVRALLRRGLIVPDALRLASRPMRTGQALNAEGLPSQGLYTLGTWRKGALYESVAVPELRGQAAALAATLASALVSAC